MLRDNTGIMYLNIYLQDKVIDALNKMRLIKNNKMCGIWFGEVMLVWQSICENVKERENTLF